NRDRSKQQLCNRHSWTRRRRRPVRSTSRKVRSTLRDNASMSELERVRELARGALLALERNRRRLDDLNVYPVPDGDTGTNLTLTVRAAVDQLHATTAPDLATLAKELTRAALMGARGNSGVILSQIIRGFAEAVADAKELDA